VQGFLFPAIVARTRCSKDASPRDTFGGSCVCHARPAITPAGANALAGTPLVSDRCTSSTALIEKASACGDEEVRAQQVDGIYQRKPRLVFACRAGAGRRACFRSRIGLPTSGSPKHSNPGRSSRIRIVGASLVDARGRRQAPLLQYPPVVSFLPVWSKTRYCDLGCMIPDEEGPGRERCRTDGASRLVCCPVLLRPT
jgi:hypothetical protein